MAGSRKQKIIRHIISTFKNGYFLNAFRMAWDVILWPDRIYHLPDHLKIEMTTQCNLMCKFCGRTYDIQNGNSNANNLSKHQKNFSLDAFTRILEQIPSLLSLDIQGTGEPLLHPQFPDILSLCTSKNIAIEFFTNATLLNAEMAEQILKANVKRLTFSIDAASPNLFAQIRKGARLEPISRNIAHFMNLKSSYKREFPYTRVMMVLSAVNLDEIAGVLELCKIWEVDEMVVTKINIPGPEWLHLEPDENALWQAIESVEHITGQTSIKFTVEIPENLSETTQRKQKSTSLPNCLWPWYSANILVDGTVTPCAYVSYLPELNMGNIYDERFGTIWNNNAYKSLRASHRTGNLKNNQPCANCNNYVE